MRTVVQANLFVIFLSSIIAACGGGGSKNAAPETSELDVASRSTSVTGALTDFFEIQEAKYKLEIGSTTSKLNVQFKRTEEEFKFDAPYFARIGHFRITATCLDEGGVPLSGFQDVGGSEIEKLFSLKPGQTAWISFVSYGKKLEKAKFFEINTESRVSIEELRTMKISDNESGSADESQSEATSSGVDCDKFIRDYNAFADSYLRLMRKYKANPSDATIANEIMEAAQKASEMEQDASACTDPAYASQLLEIANKIAKAAAL